MGTVCKWPTQSHVSTLSASFGMNEVVDCDDLITALVAEWEQIPAARLQNLVKSPKSEEWRLLQRQIMLSE